MAIAAIGSRSGALKTHLLPGAHRVFSTSDVLSGLLDVQYGWWQRIRILTWHVGCRVADALGFRRPRR